MMKKGNGPAKSISGLFQSVVERFFDDSEFNQSLVRIIVPNSCVLYIHIVLNFDLSRGYDDPVLFYLIFFLYQFFAIILSASILVFPGNFHVRRVASLIADFFAMTYMIAEGGEYSLPVYAALIFSTLGYGIRYGASYLRLSVCFAFGSLFTIAWVNPYWQANPFLIATLTITIFVVPIYALVLLSQLHRALDRAELATQEKSNFLARASHDLRQPINAIGLLAGRLKNVELSAAQSSLVGSIERSVEAAGDLFQSLLDISIIDAGGLQPGNGKVSLSILFNDLVERNKLAAERVGMRLRIVHSTKSIVTDRILAMTMLQNIISNAIKYAPNGDVLIGCRIRGNGATIWVCDQGNGIAESDLDHITEEFYRSTNQTGSEAKGSGLGLAIVKRLADKMSLDINIASVVGQGTTVEIGQFDLCDDVEHVPVADVKRQPGQLNGLRIKLIDDDPDTLRATDALLQQWGCLVEPHEEFPDTSSNFDIMISDFDFGFGKTLADQASLVKDLKRKSVPLIIISGHPKKAIQKAMKDESLTLLSKPVRPAELRSLLMAKKMELSKNSD